MKILTATQIREADQYTIQHEPIEAAALMERAAKSFVNWFVQHFDYAKNFTVKIFCGTGNNGGDGLCIARMLHYMPYKIEVYVVQYNDSFSDECALNLKRLADLRTLHLAAVRTSGDLPPLHPTDVVIDSIFGSGLNRAVDGIAAHTIEYINSHPVASIIAVDMPSGLFADFHSDFPALKASHTVGFELPKLAYMLPQCYPYIGQWHVVSIGLHPNYIADVPAPYHYFTEQEAKALIRPRAKFAHKGEYGHALLIGGSQGKIGAVILAARAALRAGAGLVTAYTPACGEVPLQTAVPEAMQSSDSANAYLSQMPDIGTLQQAKYTAIGIGIGMGKHPNSATMLHQLLSSATSPLVLDADALNLIAEYQLLSLLPPDSILTPHPKEFERLVGSTANHFERLQALLDFAKQHRVYVVLKGAHTAIATPEGECYFNSSGNPYMATAGSGDVLTGIITALLAQGYTSFESALLGVYYHGKAGDMAYQQQQQLVAGDIIAHFKLG